MKPLKWTKAHEQALALTFEGRMTHAEIAQHVGVSTRAYERWAAHPDFAARLEAMRSDFAESLRGVAYASKAQRLIGLSQMAEDARRQYEAQPTLIHVWRPFGGAEARSERFNYAAFDAFRQALTDIADELGERREGAPAEQQIALVAVAADLLDAV